MVDGIDRGRIPEVVGTDDALAGSRTRTSPGRAPCRARPGADAAIPMLERLVEDAGPPRRRGRFDSGHAARAEFDPARAEFDPARALCRRHDDPSFGDARIAASLDRTDVEYRCSFDRGFDAVDSIPRFSTVHGPFARPARSRPVRNSPVQ